MAADLLQVALDFLAGYGLMAVFVLLVLDAAMLMPVLPGEVILIMAVTTYAHDPRDLVVLVTVAVAAAMLGSLLLYAVCRTGGRRLLESHPRVFLMDPRRRERLERSFQHPFGQFMMMFLRLIPLTRVFVSIPAGLARMPLGRFVVLSAIGTLVFHAGFMWLAFEYQQPGSEVSQQGAALQASYGTPAWDYVQTNQVVAGLAALVLGAFLSLRASIHMLRDPAGAPGSILGSLAVRLLFWGSLATAGFLVAAPDVFFDSALRGGLDIRQVSDDLGFEPLPLVAYAAAAAWTVGVVLLALEKAARRRRRRVEQALKRKQDRGEQAEVERVLGGATAPAGEGGRKAGGAPGGGGRPPG